jgi:threonine/homoserine/homoserine lactone efflux protein
VTAWLGSVAVLAFVMAATPGPNNVIFAAAGARNGYLRTIPMLAGMLGGFVGLIGIGLAGVGGVLDALPASHLVLTLGASAYLAHLAVGLWHATPPTDVETQSGSAPLLTWWQMALFQVANPKTWLAVLAFVSGKLGPSSPGGTLVDVLGAACFLAVVGASASLWTLFGAALRTHLAPRSWRRAMRLMAGVAVLSIPTFWW